MKPKLIAIRPSELVILAIHNLGEKSGSSEKDIIRFLSRKYGLDEDHLTPRIKAALKHGLNFGILSFRNGRYGLEDVPEPPTKSMEGNMDEIKCNKKTEEKEASRSNRKRERSEITEKKSDIIEREIHQFKKAKGFSGDTCLKTEKSVPANGNKDEDNPGDSKPEPTASHSEEPDKKARRPARRQAGVAKGRRKAAPRPRKAKPVRKLAGRSQKKPAVRGRPTKGKPRGRAPRKNGGGSGSGTLKSIAKVFGMRSSQKPPSKTKTKSKGPGGSTKRKRKPSDKSCSRVCPSTCPNAMRRRQKQSKGKTDDESNESIDLPQNQTRTVSHTCDKMGFI